MSLAVKIKKNSIINILLADDDSDDHFFFSAALKEISMPIALTTVFDGEQLMKHLSDHSKNLPDLIFLDFNMPRKNGSTCLTEIKQNVKFKHIPVIIYSTSCLTEIADVLYANGAHYYFKKGDFLELKTNIHQVIMLLIKNISQPAREEFMLNLKSYQL